MKLAAVDIGSNAIRFQVTHVLNYNGVLTFKKLEYVRFPLRLGQDVFNQNAISPEKEAKFIKLMQTFKNLFDLYEVDDYAICATSAMREAKNGKEIAQKVKEQVGIEINIIDGEKEAELTNSVIFNELDDKSYVHIDVGGGSTELNIFINKVKTATNSFKIGSVRRLNGLDSPEEWEYMRQWVEQNIKRSFTPIIAIGTGGNIGKIYELASLAKGAKRPLISLSKIEEVQKTVAKYSYEERVNVLMLNPDRADVILPAADIYTTVMKWARSKKMLVPEVGLKDGIMLMLYEKHKDEFEKTTSIVNANKYQK